MKNTKDITNSKSTDNKSTNKNTRQYAVMTDFAVTDRRSTAAWLRGVRDGREEAWEAYRKKMNRERPELDDADLTQCYAVHVKAIAMEPNNYLAQKLLMKLWPIASFSPLRLTADFYERPQVYGERNAKVLIAMCLAILVCEAHGWNVALMIAFGVGLMCAVVVGVVLAKAAREDGDRL